jgi:hypothetical protein
VALNVPQSALLEYQCAVPDAVGRPIAKRTALRWSGTTLSEITRSHREMGGSGTLSIEEFIEERGALAGEPLFSLRLPWEQLLYGEWDTTRRRWAFDALIHLVLTQHIGRKLRRGGYVALPFDEVTRLLGNRLGPEALEATQAIGILECDKAGTAGTVGRGGARSHGYRFTPLALSYGCVVMQCPLAISKKLRAARQYRPSVVTDPIHRRMWQTLRTVGLDDGVWPALARRGNSASLVSQICAIAAVDAIRCGRWRFAVDKKTGRVFHNVNNLPSDLRPHLTLAGFPTGEADIASSQPYFLAALAYAGDDAAEAVEFRALVSSGCFYETFAEWIGLTGYDREALKKRLLTEVLFGRLEYQAKMWAAMASRFPKLAAYVERVKQDDHGMLAQLLQREEARVMHGIIVPALSLRGIACLTIHDGILARREQLPEVQRVMVAELEQATGIRPLVRIKDAPNSSFDVGVTSLVAA